MPSLSDSRGRDPLINQAPAGSNAPQLEDQATGKGEQSWDEQRMAEQCGLVRSGSIALLLVAGNPEFGDTDRFCQSEPLSPIA